MDRSGFFVAAVAALAGYVVGHGFGPESFRFPDADSTLSTGEMEEAVARAMAEPQAFARARSLIRLFEGLSTENVDGAARAIDARRGEFDPVDLHLFLTAWTQLDPETAMTTVQAWPIRTRRELAIRVVMREWAASGRQLEAGSFFDTLTDPAIRELAAGPLVRGWALAGDAEGALGLARRFWESDGRRDLIDGLVRGVLHERGAEGVFELARSMPLESGGEFAERLAQTSLNLAGREDPEAAADYYDLLTRDAPPPAWMAGSLARIAELLRADSPAAALAWLMPKPESVERSRALMETTGAWARRDFDAAWTWFEDNRPAAREPSARLDATDSAILTGLVRRMARIRPKEAAAWALRFPVEADRLEMVRRVAYFWSAEDAKSADEWISSLQLRPDQLSKVQEAAEWGRSPDATAESSPSEPSD